VLFKLGVQHIFAHTALSNNLQETGVYRTYLIKAVELAVSELAQPYYSQLGCRARMIGHDDLPELAPVAQTIEEQTAPYGPRTLWWLASPPRGSVWRRTLAAAQGASSQADLIRRYFGIDVPPVQLLIGYGKPAFTAELIPPLLIGGEVHCYFYQRPGSLLTE